MPRETVPNHSSGDFLVHVGWQKDMHMQVGITTPDDGSGQHHLVDYFYGSDPTLERIGRSLVALLDGEPDRCVTEALDNFRAAQDSDAERGALLVLGRHVLDVVTGSAEGPSTGLWWTPSRFQVNALIRLLRKARDAAHGRDE